VIVMLNPFANRKILRNGAPARATIIDMPMLDANAKPTNIAMVLRIDRAGEHPYEIRDHFMVAGDEGLMIDDVVHVAVDRGNPHRIVIDWEKTRDALARRQRALHQVVEPGVPQPVNKVRDAVQSVDPDHFERRQRARAAAKEAEQEAGAVAVADEDDPGLEGEPGVEPAPSASDDESLTSTLERLASLHAAGSLTDGEFAAAKQHVLSIE